MLQVLIIRNKDLQKYLLIQLDIGQSNRSFRIGHCHVSDRQRIQDIESNNFLNDWAVESSILCNDSRLNRIQRNNNSDNNNNNSGGKKVGATTQLRLATKSLCVFVSAVRMRVADTI